MDYGYRYYHSNDDSNVNVYGYEVRAEHRHNNQDDHNDNDQLQHHVDFHCHCYNKCISDEVHYHYYDEHVDQIHLYDRLHKHGLYHKDHHFNRLHVDDHAFKNSNSTEHQHCVLTHHNPDDNELHDDLHHNTHFN